MMDEKSEQELNRNPAAAESLGDLLRRQRSAKRLTIEGMAKDLRLPVKYLRALESNQFDGLPSDPYVRVYLRSIAKHLMLDPEDLLRRLYEAQGGAIPRQERQTQSKLDVSKVDSESNRRLWFAVFVIVALLAGLSVVATKRGWTSSSGPGAAAVEDSSAAQAPSDTSMGSPADSLEGAQAGPAADSLSDTLTAPPAAAEDKASSKDSAAAKPLATGGISLTVKVRRDSCRVQTFADGVLWRGTLRWEKRFTARDSLLVHVADNSVVQFVLNGKKLAAFPEQGVVAFKTDAAGNVIRLTLSEWQAATKGKP